MKFSILSALLLIAVVGLGIAVFQKQIEIATLRERVLAQELSGGTLDVFDVEKIHIRQLHCTIPNTLQFRIYVPEDNKQYLNFGLYFGGSTRRSVARTQAVSLLAGEHILSLYAGMDEFQNNVRTFSAKIQSTTGGSESHMPLEHYRVLENLNTNFNNWFRTEPNSLHGKQETFSPEEIQTLRPLLHLPDGVEKKFPTIQDEPVGAAIWIGPANMEIDTRLEAAGHEAERRTDGF